MVESTNDRDALNYILGSSNELLKETLDTAKSLNQRALNINRFAIPVFAGLLIFVVSETQKGLSDIGIVVIAILAQIVLLIVFYLCFQTYRLYNVYPPGTTPSELGFPDPESLEKLLISEIEASQERIKWNEYYNSKMSSNVHRALKVIAYSVPILIVLLVLEILLL